MFIIFIVFNLLSCSIISNKNINTDNSFLHYDIRLANRMLGMVKIYEDELNPYVGIINLSGNEYAVYPNTIECELRELQGHIIQFTYVHIHHNNPEVYGGYLQLRDKTIMPISWDVILLPYAGNLPDLNIQLQISRDENELNTENISRIIGEVKIFVDDINTYVGIENRSGVFSIYPPIVEDLLRPLQGYWIDFSVIVFDEPKGYGSQYLDGETVTPISWNIIGKHSYPGPHPAMITPTGYPLFIDHP